MSNLTLKLALAGALSAVLLSTALYRSLPSPKVEIKTPPQAYEAFNLWQIQHKRLYASPEEYHHRVSIFYKNSIKVAQINAENQGWTAGLNKFADLSSEEFVKSYTGFHREKSLKKKLNNSHIRIYKTEEDELESTTEDLAPGAVVDWSEAGVVTNIRNQRDCGGCYAFSASAVIQAQARITKQRYQGTLSPQELIDCSGEFETEGCNGGPIESCFEYAWIYGVAKEQDYPYTGKYGKCKSKKVRGKKTFVKNYYYLAQNHKAHRKHLREVGPMGIVIDGEGIQFYRRGIYKGKCDYADHAVVAVGYGTHKKGGPYYKILNSWGRDFGENGFFRVMANEKDEEWCEMLNFSVAAEVGIWSEDDEDTNGEDYEFQ